MDSSDSSFRLEIVVEELKSYIDCREFSAKIQFADVFSLDLKHPTNLVPMKSLMKMKKSMDRTRNNNSIAHKLPKKRKKQSSDSIIFTKQMSTLITSMKSYPMELSLYSKKSKNKLGSSHIPWSPVYIEYIYKLLAKSNPSPVHVSSFYQVYDEFASRRIAKIKLNIKLTHLKDNLISSKLLPGDNNTFMMSNLYSKVTTSLTTINEVPSNLILETGIDKRNNVGKNKKNSNNNKTDKKKIKRIIQMTKEERKARAPLVQPIQVTKKRKLHKMSSVNSITSVDKKKLKPFKNKSCSLARLTDNTFIEADSPLFNQEYCVYFAAENNIQTPKSDTQSPERINSRDKFKFSICDKNCEERSESLFSVPLYAESTDLITVKKCKQIDCNNRKQRDEAPPRDDDIRLDLTSLTKDCCNDNETLIEVVGGVQTKMMYNEKKCECTCKCTFGFIKHTTYCDVCGGFKKVGEQFSNKLADSPFPCPIFYKLNEKKGSDKSKKGEGDRIKRANKKKDARFRFRYGYVGIPLRIGHSQCAMPCTGTLNEVPKNMGWLWNADNVPGIKYHPCWRPGAIHKAVLRLLKMAKDPGTILSKKRKKTSGNKRPLKRPLLTVTKKDGEYTVTMETMKPYQKPRALNQHPYEDKPVLTYTIGRTEEENHERQKKKERQKRRLERDQRAFIQSAFKDMCQDICLKSYQQALGLLPDAEDPNCACYPKYPGPEDTNLDLSCSCSEDDDLVDSDTDSDEWIVEFTPPNAKFDPEFKGKKLLKVDNTSQYTYLDYRVKLLDRSGNQVPRFFKGPDGKTQCSDLGGFWSKNEWLKINSDGYIAPDGRWAPMIFHGPNGEMIECDNGKFCTADQHWLVVGVDGFVDEAGNWKYYPKGKDKNKIGIGKNGVSSTKNDKKVMYAASSSVRKCNCRC